MIPVADALWSALPLPALVIGAGDRIQAVNSAAETFLNQSQKSLQGRALAERVRFGANVEQALTRARQGPMAVFVKDIGVGGNGRLSTTQCRMRIVPLGAVESDEFLILLEPQDSGIDTGRGRSATSAAKSVIGMSEMLAHEIKNPLAGITGAAQLLSMSLTDQDRELTDMIVSETKRITKLLEQVEQFGNLLPPECRAVNLHDILDRARQSALLGFATDVTIAEDFDPSLPDAHGDPDQLLQVFLNLLKNAAEALADTPNARIVVRSHFDSGLRIRGGDGQLRHAPLQIEIADNGPGLPSEIAEAAFDPFVSGRENGTGLGLALVSKIVTDHGGWVSVNSVPGQTAFTVSLPAAPAKRKED